MYLSFARGQSSAAYTKDGGWFMAGGYDGITYPSEYSSTLKLINDESFEEGVEVSLPSISKGSILLVAYIHS